MGAGVVILIWLLIAAVFGVFWLGFLALFLIGRSRKSRLLKSLGGVPLLCSSVFALWFAGTAVYGFIYNQLPDNVYKSVFGFSPSADVTNIKSTYYYFADTGEFYLRFNASPQTINKIVRLGFTRHPRSELSPEDSSGLDDQGPPAWWKPVQTKSTRYYQARKRIGDFSTMEEEWLCYDASTQLAYYHYIGID
jgi:hypothetical protein